MLLVFCAAAIAGAINAVAGGGTLISFPSLIAIGVGSIPANATSTAALWPGSLGSAVGYSKDTDGHRELLVPLLIPSVIGALFGAFALVVTPPAVFDATVPFLVLFATLLFAFNARIGRLFNLGGPRLDERVSTSGRVWGFVFQFFVAAYGGYFGAGIGILMLASFSLMGLHDIHRMNALKAVLAGVINAIAFVFFALKGLVIWHLALVMAVAAIMGGYIGARTAKRLSPIYIRAVVITVGLAVSAWLFFKR